MAGAAQARLAANASARPARVVEMVLGFMSLGPCRFDADEQPIPAL
jgi:hypothetical protein